MQRGPEPLQFAKAFAATCLGVFLSSACNCGTHLTTRPEYDAGPPKPVCGNGSIETGEECDGTNLDGQTCKTLGFISGQLACTAGTCQFDTSNCSRLCGNGVCDPLEQCDGTNLCGNACTQWGVDSCDASCHLVTSSCVPTLFTVAAQLTPLHAPFVRFGPSLTAPRMDLAMAIPVGDPGPIVEIDRYDPTLIVTPDRTLGISQGFSLPFVYQNVYGDGQTDVLLASAAQTDVLLRWWDATNGLFQQIDTPLNCQIDEYALGDLNEDGKPDIVVACGAPASTIGVLVSGQTPAFAMATWLSVNEPIEGIQVVDANGDKHLDVVFRRINTNALGVLAGDGKMNFTALPDAEAGNVVGPAQLADVDVDGTLDLVVADPANLSLHLYPGTAVLAFGPAVNIATVGTPIGVRVIDLDLDGLPDILFASQPGSLAALKNLGNSPARFNFRRQDTPLPNINVTSLDVGDFDGDGDIDAVVGGSAAADAGTPGGVAVLLTNNVR